jgi:hypothetical protein
MKLTLQLILMTMIAFLLFSAALDALIFEQEKYESLKQENIHHEN